MSTIRILLIIPTLQQGGAERIVSELANYFADISGVTVHVALLAKSSDFYLLDPRIVVHRLGFENRGFFHKIKSEFLIFLKLRLILKRYKPTGVLSFMTKYNVLAIIAGSFLSTKIFVSDRSNPKLRLPLYIHVLRKFLYRKAYGVIAQTSLAKDILWAQTKNNNIAVIPNPVRNVRRIPEVYRDNIIINVGRLVPEKGQKYLIEAFSKLQNPDWKLVILGDGPLRSQLEEQVRELQLQGQVIMPGSVKDVDLWLARSSIFAFSSISEGFPNALLEAMAAGLPCVSFDCDAGPRDIIENGVNGYLVAVRDVDQMASRINDLICDESLRHSIANRAIVVREKYNIDKCARQYFDFLVGDSPDNCDS